METTPQLFTGIHDQEIMIGQEFQSLTEETLRKIGLNINWLIDIKPVGSVIFVNINQPGSVTPSADIWQECDGGEIVHPNSPMRSIGVNQHFTPDLRDRYLRGANDLSTNPTGGTQDHSLQHTHATGVPLVWGPSIQDKGDRRYRVPHTHQIATQYAEVTTLNSPAYYSTIAYMKIV